MSLFSAGSDYANEWIIKGANHVDLYDRLDTIPFDKIAEFFGKNLAHEAETTGVRTEASLAK